MFLAKVGDKVVGWLFLYPRKVYGSRCVGVQLYVNSKYRRQGIGKSLMKRAISKNKRCIFWAIKGIPTDESYPFFNTFKDIRAM